MLILDITSIYFAPLNVCANIKKQKVNNTLPSLYMRALYIKKRTSMEAHIPFPRTKRETSRVLKPTTRWRYREGDAKERRDVKREILA